MLEFGAKMVAHSLFSRFLLLHPFDSMHGSLPFHGKEPAPLALSSGLIMKVPIPALPLIDCGILGKLFLLNLSFLPAKYWLCSLPFTPYCPDEVDHEPKVLQHLPLPSPPSHPGQRVWKHRNGASTKKRDQSTSRMRVVLP